MIASEFEELRLAAIAAGYKPVRLTDDSKAFLLEGVQKPWNPLTDDGDALRLAVKLEIVPSKHDDTIVASRSAAWRLGPAHCSLWEQVRDDPYAATRLAITRAAAEIGKQMGGGNV